jgi:hypothetical protein
MVQDIASGDPAENLLQAVPKEIILKIDRGGRTADGSQALGVVVSIIGDQRAAKRADTGSLAGAVYLGYDKYEWR